MRLFPNTGANNPNREGKASRKGPAANANWKGETTRGRVVRVAKTAAEKRAEKRTR